MSIKGKPLLAHSIEHAKETTLVDRIIVSTDSEYYAEVAKSFGAEAPFLRPSEIAEDLSTDFDVFSHALTWLKDNEGYEADIIVHLRPTTPIRNPLDIDKMIEKLINNQEYDSVRSVSESPETPYKMWFMEGDQLKPVIESPKIKDAYNQPRQFLPKTYLQNASIDVCWAKTITTKKSMTGDKIMGYLMTGNHDIDLKSDLDKIDDFHSEGMTNKVFCFDIDGVIAQLSPNNDYNLSQPNTHVIARINKLYEQGNYIILFTARGSKTGIDWMEVTKKQMSDWGVSFHELKLGKPAADFYVDDRMVHLKHFL